jgi:hypothetical protein
MINKILRDEIVKEDFHKKKKIKKQITIKRIKDKFGIKIK